MRTRRTEMAIVAIKNHESADDINVSIPQKSLLSSGHHPLLLFLKRQNWFYDLALIHIVQRFFQVLEFVVGQERVEGKFAVTPELNHFGYELCDNVSQTRIPKANTQAGLALWNIDCRQRRSDLLGVACPST